MLRLVDPPVFVRTRHSYDSYRDYWDLVHFSGCPIIYPDQIAEFEEKNFYRNFIYIASPFNGEFNQDSVLRRKHKLFLWNLERPGDGKTIDDFKNACDVHIQNGTIDGVMVADKYLAKSTGYHFVPIGVNSKLFHVTDEQILANYVKTYSFVHLLCYSNRRSFLFRDPSNQHEVYNNMFVAPRGWDAVRHYSLSNSYAMLHVHQDHHFICAPLRYNLAMYYGIPIISEYCQDPYPYNDYSTSTHQFFTMFTTNYSMNSMLHSVIHEMNSSNPTYRKHLVNARARYSELYDFTSLVMNFVRKVL